MVIIVIIVIVVIIIGQGLYPVCWTNPRLRLVQEHPVWLHTAHECHVAVLCIFLEVEFFQQRLEKVHVSFTQSRLLEFVRVVQECLHTGHLQTVDETGKVTLRS
jgi:hypothetical protein